MGIKSKIRSVLKVFVQTKKIPITSFIDKENLLSGKIALITGGSSGIGKSIAVSFLKSGAKVIIASSNGEKLRRAVEEIGECDELKCLVIDISDVDALPSKIVEATMLFPENRIDILVNSSGVHHTESFSDVTEEEFDHIMNVNVKGTYFISKYVSELMIAKKIEGHILNLASSSSLRPAWGPYHISKWAIRGMTLGFAEQLLPYGIIVNAIAPGQTATPMLGKFDASDINNEYNLMGRYAKSEEIADLAVVLTSGMGNLIVGDTLFASGGSGIISLQK